MLSFLVFVGVAIYIYVDAKKREDSRGLKFAILTALFGAFSAPFYFAQRNLLEGEKREGGKWWNVVKWFALFWSVAMFIAIITGLWNVAGIETADEYESAGVAIGAGIGVMIWVVAWVFGLGTALIIGMLTKNSSIVEEGPLICDGSDKK